MGENDLVSIETTGTGLRERKKVRTRQAIQQAALRLFIEHGFEQTTVEQITEAAEVSERTFFRYFPTKADTIASDLIEPVVAEAFVGQPAGLGATAALRAAVSQVYADLPPEQVALERQRQRLVAQMAGVQAITPHKIQTVADLFTDALVRRTGRAAGDPVVRAWVGAMSGVVLTSYLAWADDPDGSDVIETIDSALRLLDEGLHP